MWQQEGWHEVVYYTGKCNNVAELPKSDFLDCADIINQLVSSFPSSSHSAHGIKDHDPNESFPTAVK